MNRVSIGLHRVFAVAITSIFIGFQPASLTGQTLTQPGSCPDDAYFALLDTDGDFIPDEVETSADVDGDGLPNYLDTDSDNDNLSDTVEFGLYIVNIDHDGDGVPSSVDDNDNDPNNRCITLSVADLVPLDTNRDGIADYLQIDPGLYTATNDPCAAAGGYTDTDRDLIADIFESDADPDNDGIPNYLDTDSDGDGLSDKHERVYSENYPNYLFRNSDSDWDGIDNEFDLDERSRDVACIVFMPKPADRNANNIDDYLEPAVFLGGASDPCLAHEGKTDSDGDLIPDTIETQSDSDGDGVPNFLDLDSDNDGLSDLEEYQGSNYPHDPYEKWPRNLGGSMGPFVTADGTRLISCAKYSENPADFNQDGLADFLDPDSDDDGLSDSEEYSYKGMFSVDTDNDQVTDVEEQQLGLNAGSPDSDGGGANDDWELQLGSDPLDDSDDASLPVDLDIDNDGIPNSLEKTIAINRDTDDDGLSDTIEAGLPDQDNNGIVDDLTDNNTNGWADIAEGLSVLSDSDTDSYADPFDSDSDQDGITDNLELNHFKLPAGYATNPNDVDNDGMPNHRDLDSDGDGIFDVDEIGSLTRVLQEYPTVAFYMVSFTDTNADGRVDQMQDINRNAVPDGVDKEFLPQKPDSDADGIVDDADIDHAVRYTDDYYSPRLSADSDGDGIENDRDIDANNDGAIDILLSHPPDFPDSDGDLIPDYLDSDNANAFIPPATDTDLPERSAAQPASSESGSTNGGGTISLQFILIMLLVSRGLGVSYRRVQ